MGLLWGRGELTRNQHLQIYNPFERYLTAERLFFSKYFSTNLNEVRLEEGNWKDLLKEKLAKDGLVTVTCVSSDRHKLQEVLNFITIEPIETDYLKGFARLVGIRRNADREEIDCELVEAQQ